MQFNVRVVSKENVDFSKSLNLSVNCCQKGFKELTNQFNFYFDKLNA